MAYETHNAIMQLVHEEINPHVLSRVSDHIAGKHITVTCAHGDINVQISSSILYLHYSRRKWHPSVERDFKQHQYELSDPKTTISAICDKIIEYHNASK